MRFTKKPSLFITQIKTDGKQYCNVLILTIKNGQPEEHQNIQFSSFEDT